jgi:hypothetical protein
MQTKLNDQPNISAAKTPWASLATPVALGYSLLWLGFLGAAYSAVARTEQVDKWSTIPWTWYLISLAVGFAGVFLVRRAKSRDALDETKTESEYSIVRSSLDAVTSSVALLREGERHPAEVLKFIDERCAEPLSEFAESRQSIVKRFGMKVYAEVMTEFATAERLINRSWSAAADGYVDEIAASLSRAASHLQHAQELLQRAEATRDAAISSANP